jgi:predicted ATP-grasp superfamily ATP-dependent carboligase
VKRAIRRGSGAAMTVYARGGVRTGAESTGRKSAGSKGYDVLVLDANYKQSVAIARSLGRAGLRVAMGDSVDEYPAWLTLSAFRSRYSAHTMALPSYANDGAQFGAAVVEFVRANPTRVVLPTGDASIAALMPLRNQLATLGCVLAIASDAALEIANDKDRTLEIAAKLGIETPTSIQMDTLDDLPAATAQLGFPFVLKPTVSWTGQAAERVRPIEVVDKAEAMDAMRHFMAAGARVLAQQLACGRREGVTLFVVDDEIIASFAHLEHRTTPPLGGASVVRESIPLPNDIYTASIELVRAVGLQGPCEVEFRRDADNRPLLMEINARLTGTVENAMIAGIDFPLMTWQWATGLPAQKTDKYRNGIRMRWLRGDLRWLRENYGRVGRPDSVPRRRALFTFLAEFTRTRHYDFWDWRDPGPAVADILIMTAKASRISGK